MSSAASLFSTIARGAHLAPQAECPKCHETYTLGVDGTVEGCDQCLGVTRALNGYVIEEPACACYEVIGDNKNCPVPEHRSAAQWMK